MVCGYGATSKVVKYEKDLSSNRCRGCRGEEVVDLLFFAMESSSR